MADLNRTSCRAAWAGYLSRLRVQQHASRPRTDGSVADRVPCIRCARALAGPRGLPTIPGAAWGRCCIGAAHSSGAAQTTDSFGPRR